MPVLTKPTGMGYKEWLWEETYQGTAPADGQTLWVVETNDSIRKWDEGIFQVVSVVNNIPVVELKARFNQSTIFDMNSGSLVTGLSMYQPTAVTLIFIDKTSTPYRLDVDSRYSAKNAEASEMKLFLGSDTSTANAVVISEYYDTGGVFIGTEVPLMDVSPTDPSKIVPAFNTSRNLKGGDVVTAVIYKADHQPIGSQVFMVVESATIRGSSIEERLISHINLKSPLIDTNEPDLIRNTQGVDIGTSLFSAELTYTDGDTVPVPIDGTKCAIHGLDDFDTSRIGGPSEIILSYYPSATEPFIGGTIGNRPHVSAVYRLLNKVVDTAYALKLWPLPTYTGVGTGYTVKWFITNMAGDLEQDVTNFVTAKLTNGADFSGLAYAVEQEILLAINMNNVAPAVYPDHVHTQRMFVTLNIPGAVDWSPWVIDYIGAGGAYYGMDTYVSVANHLGGKISVKNEQETLELWLRKMYNTIAPMYDPSVSLEPRKPTHFRLEYNGFSTEHPVSAFNTIIDKHVSAPVFVDNQTMNLVWLLKDGTDTFTLGMSPMLIRIDL